LDFDQGFRVLGARAPSRRLSLEFGNPFVPGIHNLRHGPTLLWLGPGQLPALPSRAPGRQVRGVQALPSQQRPNCARRLTPGLGFSGHAVGEGNAALKALIGAASEFLGPGFLLPTRNADMFRWCLERGLRIVQPMTLMSIGLYNEPQGVFLPSIVY
jgi:hypothetical protein